MGGDVGRTGDIAQGASPAQAGPTWCEVGAERSPLPLGDSWLLTAQDAPGFIPTPLHQGASPWAGSRGTKTCCIARAVGAMENL